jgi:hypothetical protein
MIDKFNQYGGLSSLQRSIMIIWTRNFKHIDHMITSLAEINFAAQLFLSR